MLKFKWLEHLFSSFRKKEWSEMTRSEKGAYGERLALQFCLKRLGYKCIAKNWRHRKYEIDIVCKDGPLLVFIEVRLRSQTALISWVHSIDRKKKSAIRNGAIAYINKLNDPPSTYRFDIISVAYGDAKSFKITHYQNVALF